MARAKTLLGGLRSQVPEPTTVNRDGFAAYTRPLEEQYLQTLVCNTLGNTFYADQKKLLAESVLLHTKMAATDPTYMAKALIYARNEGFMRLQPILGLTKLLETSPTRFRQVFPQVVRIPSDLQDFMVTLGGQGKGQGGRAVKTAVGNWMQKMSEYWAIKYAGEGRGFSLRDILRTVHPKPANVEVAGIWAYLLGKGYDPECYPQLAHYEALKTATTDEERIKHIVEGRLPHEVVTAVVQNPSAAIWEALLKVMPAFAMLRNMNTMDRAGVLKDKANIEIITKRLTDAEQVRKAKILPFRFAEAYKVVSNGQMRDVLRMAVNAAADNIPDIKGKTAIFLDRSGSMQGFIDTAALFALALWRKAPDGTIFWLYDDRVEEVIPSKVDSILTQSERFTVRGGTATYLPMKILREKQEKVDNIILITDEQQNIGGTFAPTATWLNHNSRNTGFIDELYHYRAKVNRDAKCFVVDVAPYASAMVPATDPLTHFIYGWSDLVLKYIGLQSMGLDGQVAAVKAINLYGENEQKTEE